jgi:hypothetical protein
MRAYKIIIFYSVALEAMLNVSYAKNGLAYNIINKNSNKDISTERNTSLPNHEILKYSPCKETCNCY